MDPASKLPEHEGRRITRRMLVAALVVPFCGATAGCLREWTNRQNFGPALQADVDKEALVSRINANIQRTHNWECDSVKVTSPGFVGSITAHILVQTPRNFRLRAKSLMGDELDCGSNDERFWFWAKRDPNQFVQTVRHEDLPRVQRAMNLPFQPDWLMQVMGVIPLDAGQFTLLPPAQDGSRTLRSDTLSADGRPVTRIVRVNQHALIIEHQLYDAAGVLIAKAQLSRHRLDRESGAILPHRVALNWQQAGMAMTLDLGDNDIPVNHLSADARAWEVPRIPGAPERDLGREIPGVPVGRAALPSSGHGAPHAGAQYAQLQEPPWEQQQAVVTPASAGEPPWSDPNEPPWSESPPATQNVQWRPASNPSGAQWQARPSL